MSTVIAEMQLDYFIDDQIRPGFVRIAAPEIDGNSWRCRYEIEWPGYRATHGMMGVDSLQALALTLKIIPVMIATSDDFKAGKIGIFGERMTSEMDLSTAIGIAPMKGAQA